MPRFLIVWFLAALSIGGFVTMYLNADESEPRPIIEPQNKTSSEPQDWLEKKIEEQGNEGISGSVLDMCSIASASGDLANISQCGPPPPDE